MKKVTNKLVQLAMVMAVALISSQALAADNNVEQGATVNINTATAQELAYLPGVGVSTAEAIIKYRKSRPFKKPQHIIRVKGVGRKTYSKMQQFLSISGPTTITKKLKIRK